MRPYTIKDKARHKSNYAVAKGELSRMPCSVCGEKTAEKHHPDYNDPMRVLWLYKEHHMDAHWPTKFARPEGLNSLYHFCIKCSHQWIPRSNDKPKGCPACKSFRWDKPREKKEEGK